MSKTANINPPVIQEKGEFYRGRLWKYSKPGLPLHPFVVEEVRRLKNPGMLQNYHSYYLVLLITEGAIVHVCENERKRLVPGQVMLIPPGFLTFYPETGYHKYLIGFSGRGIDRLFSDFGLNSFMTIAFEPSDFLKIFRQLYRRMGLKSKECIPDLLADSFRLLSQLALADDGGEARQNPLLADKIRLKLEEEIAAPYPLAELSRQLGIPLSSLHRIFYAEFGISPKRYQFELRMRYALELLELSDLSIKEIADRTGFRNQYYFSNVIRKIHHASPRELRKFLRERGDTILPPANEKH